MEPRELETGEGSWRPMQVPAGVCALAPAWLALRSGRVLLQSEATSLLQVVFVTTTSALALLLAGFALFGHRPEVRARVLCALVGGGLVGGIGLVAGFVGPLIFAPSANQGPLLGIFVTGPLGFVLGLVMGLGFTESPWRRYLSSRE